MHPVAEGAGGGERDDRLLDRADRRAGYLHLSISRQAVPVVPCSPVEANFPLSLFFAPHEYIFLSSAPGTTVPVTHYYLRTFAEDIPHAPRS